MSYIDITYIGLTKPKKTILQGRKRSMGTKTYRVLKHLKVFGSITTMDAFYQYNATRLSAIIFNLKEQGFQITSTRVYGKHHVVYSLDTFPRKLGGN